MAGEGLVDLRYLSGSEKEGLRKVACDDIQFVKENLGWVVLLYYNFIA